jgi:uncharacterized protein YjdB
VYQAHAQDAGTVCCVSAGSTSARSSVILPIPPKWSTPVDEGQTVTSTGILQTFPDAFRVQSTIAGTVFCQANVSGLGWQPEVTDSQPCGSIDQKRPVFGIRFRLADTDSALHVLYRCRVGNTWTKFVADGTPCGATGLNVGITAIQVQYSDAPLSGLTYRALSSSSSTMGPWVDEGATAGQPVTRLNAIQVHSNVGGLLRCQPNVGPDGWQNQVEDNKLCGSTDNSKHVDAFTLMLAGGPPGVVVQYRSKVSGQDWGPWVQNGQVSGSPDSGITLEQVQVRYVHTP